MREIFSFQRRYRGLLKVGMAVCLSLSAVVWAQQAPQQQQTGMSAESVKSQASLFSSMLSNTGNLAGSVVDAASGLVMNALNLIGVRYRYGGNSPATGLDCSGFVRYVFNDTLGFLLPRRAKEMSQVGEQIAQAELKPGDLVFFNTMRRTFSHVGIYIGDNKFVHAPSSGGSIRIDDIESSYWASRFNGARRVDSLENREVRLRLNEAIGFAKVQEGRL